MLIVFPVVDVMFNDSIDRAWLLTWTTYGSWLPGDDRGFVSHVRDESGEKLIRRQVETAPLSSMPQLESYARSKLKTLPIRLDRRHAELLAKQFTETADYRGWVIFAIGIMTNHLHLVVGAVGDPEPEKILADFKSYGSRKLNAEIQGKANSIWWTKSGSKRKLPDEQAVLNAIRYIRDQEYPLYVWIADIL